ncbi:response regulator transcription factor [Alistipes sp.]|uniref:response regulator n=1 Tax=Alistipes sp. TaxID=1872444 RepID=UPI0025B8EC3F|nr:response regulator transcription factor [Alistipes sp.]MCI7140185.1 response regulator transcription factor [Alistipes sp.]MDY5396404.1 response regulator transcription factor [Alistipes sp.]
MTRRIVLVDDHTLFRNGLRGLLERQEGYRVVGEAASGEEFLAQLDTLEADVVFMDFSMPGLDGAQTTERALARRPGLRIITLSMFGEESYYSRMVEAGARGFLLKDSDMGDVLEAVETVMEGGSYFSPQLLSSLTGRMRSREDAADDQLSTREREILVAVCRGLSNQEIADELFISKRTVDKHRANILEKTGCKNTASLVVYAIRNGIVEL